MSIHAQIQTTNVFKLFQLIFLTLIIGLFFNSTNLYVKATTWEESPKKNVAVSVLKPLSLASRAFGINSIRENARQLIGLERDDKIDDFEFKTKDKTITKPKPSGEIRVKQRLSPENKLTSWIIGDSLATIPGESLLSQLPIGSFDVYGLDSRVSTGFSRPDVFNWSSNIYDFVTNRKPESVVISIGANDDQPIYIDGTSIGPFGSENWKNKYYERVNATLDFLAQNNVFVLWVEIPPVRDPVRNARYDIINQITSKAISEHKANSVLVETRTAFTDTNGIYNASLPVYVSETLLRTADGIHFTRAGGNLIARLVIEKLRVFYDF